MRVLVAVTAVLLIFALGYASWWLYGEVTYNRIYLYPVDELPQGDPDATPIIGGRLAEAREFAASFYFEFDKEPCTSTLIGPSVLLTAAHCVPHGEVFFGLGGGIIGAKSVRARCTHAPTYHKDPAADYALCRLHNEITSTLYFETINTEPGLLKPGQDRSFDGLWVYRRG